MAASTYTHDKRFSWLKVTKQGLYCEPGGFYIDPQWPVEHAVISHGHADHARPGHTNVLATSETLAIMRHRYRDAAGVHQQALRYDESVRQGDVDISFKPAGHILGSAQVVLDYNGTRIIFSGDYKRRPDPTCTPFEVTTCDLFITEATFGIPVFTHPDASHEAARLLASLREWPARAHLLGVYALGKCQRLIVLLRQLGYDDTIYLHGAHAGLCEVYEALGVKLGRLEVITKASKNEFGGKLILCPPSAIADRWSRRFGDAVFGAASGWMRVLQRAKQKNVELPLIVSDHCDWPELLQTVQDVQADTIWVTHGQEDALVHYCRSIGLAAEALSIAGLGETGSGGEDGE